ncbi:hypothetical protein HRbin21_01171 [bacterium HR21]|nr:hypothetical protein HRbin21_01171 [bacterium HR21]
MQPVESVPDVLEFGDLLGYAFRWGFGQYFNILLMLLLWVLTIWIPYVNIGTTIAVTTGAPILLSRQQRISPTFIFNREYRTVMADWLLLLGLMVGAVLFALVFVLVPALVLSFGWLLAPLLLVDRGMGVLESLRRSWQATLGEKWTLFFGLLAVYFLYLLPAGLILWLLWIVLPKGESTTTVIMRLYTLLAYAGLAAVDMGFTGYVYAVLGKRVS